MAYPWETDAYKQVVNALSPYPKRVIDEATKNDILEEQSGQYVLIGHTLKWCTKIESTLNEATSLAEKYYNRLVELGDIKPKKSTEDMLLEAMNAIKYLADKVDQLESNNAKPVIMNPITEIVTETEVASDGINGDSKYPINKRKSGSGEKSKE